MENLIKNLLIEMAEDPSREGLIKTPTRVSETLKYLTSGYQINIDKVIGNAIFEAPSNDMVILKDIEVFSLCEHHLLPFYGVCHIGYIPNGKILGLSKLAKIVNIYARRLQIQERLTNQVAKTIEHYLNPVGIGVIIKAKHLCMIMRGVQKYGSEMITSCMLGNFKKNSLTRAEFLSLIDK